jgi:hypothetical protein
MIPKYIARESRQWRRAHHTILRFLGLLGVQKHSWFVRFAWSKEAALLQKADGLSQEADRRGGARDRSRREPGRLTEGNQGNEDGALVACVNLHIWEAKSHVYLPDGGLRRLGAIKSAGRVFSNPRESGRGQPLWLWSASDRQV